jgi:DHA2 family multidrug resistance protein
MSETRAEPLPPAAAAPAGEAGDLRLAWICFSGLLMGQFLAVLDVQIVASSIAVIQSDLGAAADEISWIQTCYLIAETLGIPLVGFFTRLIGMRQLFALVCAAFIATSLVIGVAQDLTSMIVARTLQGFVGGLMLPMAFTYGFTAFPEEKKYRVSLILAIVSVLAPTVGPILGGYVSDHLGWRWLFFINIVPGIGAMMAVWSASRPDEGKVRPRPTLDWRSLVLLSLCLMSTQYVLEQGQHENWLESDAIAGLILLAIVTGILFVHRSLAIPAPLLDLRLYGQHSFRAGSVLIMVGGLSLFGGSYVFPLFLAEVRDYSPLQIGETLLVSGVVMVTSGLLIVPRLKGYDLRIPVACGFAATGYGFWLGHEATAQWDYWEFALLQVWRGAGVIIAVTGTQTIIMSRMPPAQASSATSLLYLARNFGGAVGVAVLSSTLVLETRQAYSDLVSGARLDLSHLSRPGTGALQAQAIEDAARVLAYNQCFALVAMACLVAAVLALTLGAGRKQ